MSQTTNKRVLLCFSVHEAFSVDERQILPMVYKSTFHDLTMIGNSSIMTEMGNQRWINNSKHVWVLTSEAYAELQNSGEGELAVDVFLYNEAGENGCDTKNVVSEFQLPIPDVNDSINWDELFEISTDDVRFHFHLHAQPYYIDEENEIYKESKVNGVIRLTAENSKPSTTACNYDFTISIDRLNNWHDMAAILEKSHLQSKHYSLITTFNRDYKSLPRSSFEETEGILCLDPLSLYGSIHLISRFLQSLQAPSILLVDSQQQTLCSFCLDFERFALNLASCPSDNSITEGTGAINLRDTIELRDVLDNTQHSEAMFQNLVHTGCTVEVTLSIRKHVMISTTSNSIVNSSTTQIKTDLPLNSTHTNNTLISQVEVLNRKLINMEQFQKETVENYEKELTAKQKTIYLLTQANREFEKLCVDYVKGGSNDSEVIRLRSENSRLMKEIEEMKKSVKEAQRQKDEMREVMVRICTTGKKE